MILAGHSYGGMVITGVADRARQLDGHRNLEIDTGHDLMMTEPRNTHADLNPQLPEGLQS